MRVTLLRVAVVVALLVLTLGLPAVAPGSGGPNQTPTTESCTGAGCQPAQDPAVAGLVTTTTPQRENVNQAGYVLCGLLVVLLVSIPIAVTWQRSVRQKAISSVGQNAEIHPLPPRS